MSWLRHRCRDESGASAVEFALVALVFIMLLTGIIQFGFTFFQYLEVVHAAREGARWASLGTTAGSVADPTTTRGRTAAAAPGLNPGLTDDQIDVQVAGGGETAVLPGDSGKPVSVAISYESPVFIPLMADILEHGSFQLHSTATLRVE